MDIGIIILIIVVVLAIGGVVSWRIIGGNPEERAKKRQEQEEREQERKAEQEKRKREEWMRQEELRRAEESATVEARERMVIAAEELAEVQADFRQAHDDLIDLLQQQAKQGCDAQFQQRFGITRPPKAETPEEDPEVQEYLRSNYATLRDAALDIFTEGLIQKELERRLALEEDDAADTAATPEQETPGDNPQAEPEEQGEEAASESPVPEAAKEAGEASEAPEAEAAEEAAEAADADGAEETPDEEAEAAETEAAAEPEAAEEPEDTAEVAEPEVAEEPAEPAAGEDEPAPEDAHRQELEETVRAEYDFESARTYGLAAISAHFNSAGELVGDVPWPAYTKPSQHGYGELALVAGAPAEAQDDYRDFAWKKFHTGRRTERPSHGEYSWGADHLVGDADAGLAVETPMGALTIAGPKGPLALREMHRCPWVRHDLAYQELLLVPASQRTVFASLLGLRKGDRIEVRLDGPDILLQEVEGAPFVYAAIGEHEGTFLGLTASNPEQAAPGDAPFELIERGPDGFVFQMTADARPFDEDTFPQFIEATVAWCAAPSPKPERLIRHVTR